jgi:hypothetical protein
MDRDNRRPDVNEPLDVWQMLGDIPPEPANSAAMRSRFDAALHAERRRTRGWRASILRRGQGHATFRPWALAAAAVAVLALGIVIGRSMTFTSRPDPALADLRQELHDMRQMVALSLLQQQSASERLKGVTWTGEIERPGGAIVSALLDTLVHDPNVNVRLASIDALKRFADQQRVREATVDALARQMSPLVQVALIDFMVEVNEREALPQLRRLSQDAMVNQTVRERAAWGLQRIG